MQEFSVRLYGYLFENKNVFNFYFFEILWVHFLFYLAQQDFRRLHQCSQYCISKCLKYNTKSLLDIVFQKFLPGLQWFHLAVSIHFFQELECFKS